MASTDKELAIDEKPATRPISDASLSDSISTPISKPVEAKTQSRSLSSNDNSFEDVEKQEIPEPPQDMSEAKKVQSVGGESLYPDTKQVVVVMIALYLAVFLVALDRTIIATAIPKITDDFHSLDDIGWYGSAFMLTSSCFQLFIGRIYTFYTPKYVFLIIIGIFEIGSAICGAAPNSLALIIGRAVAGIGSAGIMSGAVVLMVGAIPLAKRPVYMGLLGASFGVASVVGPLLGGVFTTDVSWRWCFYINLPIGGCSILAILIMLKPTEPAQKGLTIRQQLGQLDLLGEFFLFPCVICLLLALQWGGTLYSWSDGRIIALFTLFGVLLIGFVLVETFMQKTATIPKRVISKRSIIGAMWFQICNASTMMMVVYYLPVWFQAIKGVSAVESGIRTIPLVLSLVIASIFTGQVVGRLGYYTPFLYASAVIVPIGVGLLTTFNLDTSEGMWIGYQILIGFGLGVGMQQPSMAAQTVLDKKDVPIGVSLIFFCQMLGGAIFVSVGQNVFDSNLVKELVKLVKNLDPGKVVNTGATDLRGIVPPTDLREVLVVYNLALRHVFIVATAVACLSVLGALLVEWKSVKGNKGGPGSKPGENPAKQEAETKS